MLHSLEGMVGIYGATLVVAALSGFIPVINAEIYLVAVTLAMRSVPLAIVLGLIVAIGQMIAKVGIYKVSAGAANKAKTSAKIQAKLDKVHALMAKWKDKPYVLVFVSAVFGLPPFFVVSILAGMLKLDFKKFLVLGTIGRTLRFVAIALIALLF